MRNHLTWNIRTTFEWFKSGLNKIIRLDYPDAKSNFDLDTYSCDFLLPAFHNKGLKIESLTKYPDPDFY